MGVTVLPPMPAFYNQPKTLDDMVDHIVARTLDQFGIEAKFAKRWTGEMRQTSAARRKPGARSKTTKEDRS